jgi:hypothetical protein
VILSEFALALNERHRRLRAAGFNIARPKSDIHAVIIPSRPKFDRIPAPIEELSSEPLELTPVDLIDVIEVCPEEVDEALVKEFSVWTL